MAKFFGMVGYAITKETAPGVWTPVIEERPYYGDVLRDMRDYQNGDGLNDNLNISNEISIVADPFAYSHFYAMRYIEYMGAQWKVTKVNVQRPRLVLTIGGVYNGPEGDCGETSCGTSQEV